MMSTAISQPIAGVSIDRETELDAIYPSVAAGSLGRFIGTVMQRPVEIGNTPLRLSALLLCGTAMAPLSVLAYATGKLTGTYHVMTNRSIEQRTILGSRKLLSIPISDVDSIEITTMPGYKYHHVGDLVLRNAAGATLHVIPAIVRPEKTRHLILETRLGRQRTDAALAQIQSRSV